MARVPYLPALLLALLLFLGNAVLAPALLDPTNLARFLFSALPLALLAAGQTLVILGGGIDLSSGALLTLSLVVAATLFGERPLLAPLVALLVAGVGGLVNGLAVAYLRLQPLVATFATGFLFSGLALWVLPRPGGSVPPGFQDLFAPTWVPPTCFLLLAVLGRLVARSPFGRCLYAAGGSPQAAYANGVPVARVLLQAYLMGGLLSGAGGLLLLAETGTGDPLVGQPLTLPAIAAVALGGTRLSGGAGSVEGSLLGALLLALFRNLVFFLGVPSNLQLLAEGVVVLLALAASNTLLGRRLWSG